MKLILWNADKNKKLKTERGVCFEDMLYYIENELIIDIIQHPNVEKYNEQKIYLININNYVYLIPFVEEAEYIFLKTIIPSRKYTKLYLGVDTNYE